MLKALEGQTHVMGQPSHFVAVQHISADEGEVPSARGQEGKESENVPGANIPNGRNHGRVKRDTGWPQGCNLPYPNSALHCRNCVSFMQPLLREPNKHCLRLFNTAFYLCKADTDS
jgi:hypothetical protein